MADEKNTQFNYLLNAMERAGQSKSPAQEGYGSKRKALLAHVRELERKAMLADELEQLWNVLVQRAKETVLTMPGESEFDLIQRAMLPRRPPGVKVAAAGAAPSDEPLRKTPSTLQILDVLEEHTERRDGASLTECAEELKKLFATAGVLVRGDQTFGPPDADGLE